MIASGARISDPRHARSLAVAHIIHSGGFYGAERVVHDLVFQQAAGTGVRPTLIDVVDAGLEESELGRRLRNTAVARVVALPTRRGLTRAALGDYARTLRELKPDIVHSHGYKPTVLHIASRMLRMHNVPLVVTAHGYTLTSPSLKDRLYQWLDVWMLSRAEATIAVSHAMARYLAAQTPSVRTQTIPNGMDARITTSGRHPLRDYLTQHVQSFAAADRAPIIVGSVGRLVPMKNHAMLIDAVADLIARGVHCLPVILGNGPLREQLDARWRNRIPSVEPLLIPHQQDVLDWMGDMDVYCMPSGPGEGLPMALLEAGLLERPVVCTTSGGMADLIVDRDNGLLVEMGDTASFATAVAELVGDAALRSRLGANLRATIASEYDLATVARRYEEVYRSVAG